MNRDAHAGVGSADSPPGTLDASAPEVTLTSSPPGHTIYHGGDSTLFAWITTDLHPGTAPASHRGLVEIDGAAVDSLVAPSGVGDLEWAWVAPEVNSNDCYLVVVAVDAYGNQTSVASNRFTVLVSTTDVPDRPAGGPATLLPASPNPFNPATRIAYELATAGEVRLVLHDARGRRVRALDEGPREAGRHAVIWDGTDAAGRRVAAGAYLLRLSWRGGTGAVERTGKVVMVP